eukprot:GHVS01089498.1.p1 GENE.GHVS01089498.1~~GHVS01089498.1.p1  ORF type:complete len:117 (+),score=3.03 GHVS01089498.1:112-462(+)
MKIFSMTILLAIIVVIAIGGKTVEALDHMCLDHDDCHGYCFWRFGIKSIAELHIVDLMPNFSYGVCQEDVVKIDGLETTESVELRKEFLYACKVYRATRDTSRVDKLLEKIASVKN